MAAKWNIPALIWDRYRQRHEKVLDPCPRCGTPLSHMMDYGISWALCFGCGHERGRPVERK